MEKITTIDEKQKEFSNSLKNQLVANSVDLESISKSRNINLTVLNNLVNGNFSKLPQKIFCKGFIHQICQEAGIEHDRVLVQFEEAWAEAHQEKARSTESHKLLRLTALASTLIIIGLIAIFFAPQPLQELDTVQMQPAKEPSSQAILMGPLPYARMLLKPLEALNVKIILDGRTLTKKLAKNSNHSFLFSEYAEIEFEESNNSEVIFNGKRINFNAETHPSLKKIVLKADKSWDLLTF